MTFTAVQLSTWWPCRLTRVEQGLLVGEWDKSGLNVRVASSTSGPVLGMSLQIEVVSSVVRTSMQATSCSAQLRAMPHGIQIKVEFLILCQLSRA